uniref:Uncharacterized protein n=1 Tax=Arion vulgaris TaxID=1028688 RepID=A0A0B7AS86_9EUPU
MFLMSLTKPTIDLLDHHHYTSVNNHPASSTLHLRPSLMLRSLCSAAEILCKKEITSETVTEAT